MTVPKSNEKHRMAELLASLSVVDRHLPRRLHTDFWHLCYSMVTIPQSTTKTTSEFLQKYMTMGFYRFRPQFRMYNKSKTHEG